MFMNATDFYRVAGAQAEPLIDIATRLVRLGRTRRRRPLTSGERRQLDSAYGDLSEVCAARPLSVLVQQQPSGMYAAELLVPGAGFVEIPIHDEQTL